MNWLCGFFIVCLVLSYASFLVVYFLNASIEKDLRNENKRLHAELLAIHKICCCIAECPLVNDDDSWTVKAVNEMAYMLNKAHKKAHKKRQNSHER